MNTYQDYEVKRLERLRNFREVLTCTKNVVREIDPLSRIIFFGSVHRGDYNAGSDIDLIIIPSEMRFKDRITIAIWKHVDAPVELHIITKEQFEGWYLRFIDDYEEL